ncbi:UNVERIFIED_CONTAM: hypothetical protein GTU68_023202 [Idotea baltica]|nr:hypothetical protein [Idotea baltica]
MRSDAERAEVDGKSLVNEDHPQVVEIWNLVFIQYQRFSDKSLQPLPAQHIDTGMGFERLCMVLQNKTATYDTDIFTPLIDKICTITGFEYGKDTKTDIAIRVIADHIRAISFTIADGQLPSNTGAGYVIRRILRRAVRYAFSQLNTKEALLYKLVPILDVEMGEAFPEIRQQKDFIAKVIQEEENAFLRTLGSGIKRFNNLKVENKTISGADAFELYDTYGFPIDLTQLMASEKDFAVDMDGFKAALEEQKSRSRSATSLETGDWVIVNEAEETGNHTATHLLHASLKQVLGEHVNQKGSLVAPGHLRFDFSHFSKVTNEEIMEVEKITNAKIIENIAADIQEMSFDDATAKGATALFGEKYGDKVRVVTFDPEFSMELCGGSHVKATGEIGFCKVTVETSVAAGVRRIEAITGEKAYEYLAKEMEALREIKTMFKNPKDILGAVQGLADKNEKLTKEIDSLHMQKAAGLKNELKGKVEVISGVNTVIAKIDAPNADAIKKIAYDLRNEVEDLFCVLGANLNGKANLTVMIADSLVESKKLNAGQIIRNIASHVKGGGGGQAFFATAGGKNPDGIDAALTAAKELL